MAQLRRLDREEPEERPAPFAPPAGLVALGGQHGSGGYNLDPMSRSHLLAQLACVLMLAGCNTRATAAPPPTPTPSETVVPTPSFVPPTSTATLTPPPPTATPTATCPQQHGEVLATELIDPELPRSLPYRIYQPPCADRYRGELPTLYLLHGLSYTDSQWVDLNAPVVADLLIRLRIAPPFLIVMPWERLGLDYEPTIVEYLLPHIVSEYGGSPERELRAIGGISRGGGWALRIGMAHPGLFGAVGLHSPAVLMPDLFNLPEWVESGSPQQVWVDIGNRDPLRSMTSELTELLDDLQVPYEFHQFTGEHASFYWLLHTEEYIRWYVSNWN